MTVEERITELQKQIDELKKEVKNKFKRVDEGEYYYTVGSYCGKAKVITACDKRDNDYNDKRFEYNNYFLTEERAKEVAEKINTLLKLERIHDMLCPDYKPDWHSKCEEKWFITDNKVDGNVYHIYNTISKNPVATYFPEDKIDEAIKLYKEMS